MPDITMCMSKNCDRREKCYRSQATPARYQTYSNFEDFCNEGNFEYFWKIEDRGDDNGNY